MMRLGWKGVPQILLVLLVMVISAAGIGSPGLPAAGQDGPAGENPKPAATAKQPSQEDQRIEGEKRFHNNCGRCHMAPQKFPPRVMAMVVRHMRVRANITDEDMRLILNYMTQ